MMRLGDDELTFCKYSHMEYLPAQLQHVSFGRPLRGPIVMLRADIRERRRRDMRSRRRERHAVAASQRRGTAWSEN